jgi:glycolate oxidase iron-sulfur subunit
METHFSPEQLTSRRFKEAEAILRRCVHCGLCNPACPTYVLTGDEREGPRGRIYLVKGLLEAEARGASPLQAQAHALAIRPHLDRCLTCLSCVSACPSGVEYGKLIDLARAHVEAKAKRPLNQRLTRWFIGAIVPYAWRFNRALIAAPLARPFRGLLRLLRLEELAAMLDLAPASPFTTASSRPPTPPAPTKRRARAVLLWGCAQPSLRPEIHASTIRLLTRKGVEIVLAPNEGCCGALDLHMGREAEAKAAARRNIDAWAQAHVEGRLDAIIIDAAGCGSMIKDYGDLLADDPAYAARAKAVSALAKDVTEFIVSHDIGAPRGWTDIRVAYHSACALQHGQRIHELPIKLLQQSGFTVLEVPEGHLCCGSAGSYSLLQPATSERLRARKLANIASIEPDCVAAGNIGCINHLGAPDPEAQVPDVAPGIPVAHTIELLDWAHGGPCPQPLRHLESRMRRMSSFIPPKEETPAEENAPDQSEKKPRRKEDGKGGRRSKTAAE